jgi:acetyltransferase-like isoleucine patch superfamily enzyme
MERFIAKTAKVGKGTTIGFGAIIMDRADIGEECIIGNNVVIHPGTVLGKGVRVDDGTVLGKLPMRAAFSTLKGAGEIQNLVIGEKVLIGANVVIYSGCTIGNFVMVADLATVREDVSVGDYTIVGRCVAIENKTSIGKYCKLETNSYITADSVVEDYCFIAPCVTTTNDNFLGRTKERFKHRKGAHVKRGARIGGGAVLLPGVEIGEDALVGAGSVVTRNVEARKVFYGVPARYVRETPREQLLENQEEYARAGGKGRGAK